jgi:hypothetical protein
MKIFADFCKKTRNRYEYLLKTSFSERMYQRICVFFGSPMAKERRTSPHNPNVCVSCSSVVDETDFVEWHAAANQEVSCLKASGDMVSKPIKYFKPSAEEFADTWHN